MAENNNPNIKSVQEIANQFSESSSFLNAISDGIRQDIILEILKDGNKGTRVGELAKHCNLSRPAVSHHLQILRDAGVLSMRSEGTKNYYFVNTDRKEFQSCAKIYII